MLNVSANWRRQAPLLVIAAIAAALIFTNLGSGYLWADEGDTAVLAQNILKFGVPQAWDGKTFMDSDFGARVNANLVMVSSPWLQYYITAASFALFGENTFAARFPFALAGWLTILFVYRLVWTTTADRRAALCGSILLMCSVQFLLFCRESRYYTLMALFTCCLIAAFLRMRSVATSFVFGICSVLLFHTHPIGIVPVLALGALTLVGSNFSIQRRCYWFTLPAILALTVPWFFQARTGYAENTALVSSVREFFLRFAQYFIECASVTPLIGIIVLGLILLGVRSATQQPQRALLIAIGAVGVSLILGAVATQRTAAIWVTGVRYTSAIIPLLAIIAGLLISNVSRGKTFPFVSLILAFTVTKFAQITPWTFWADKNPNLDEKLIALHVPNRAIDAFLPGEDLLFVRDLFRENTGTLGRAVEFLRQHAAPGDLLITNYESEPLYFHTRLPQGMKIMRQDPIYEAARRRGLPEYTFGVDHARWIVWRFNWDDYLGIRWTEVAEHLSSEGGQIADVAEIPETSWENRENIHFHRFAENTYLFAQEADRTPARIFRVDWPQTP